MMKKTTILLVLIITYTNIFANLIQGNWRWRNDDGSETTATWKAAEVLPIILTSTGEVLRLRYELHTSGAPIFLNISERLQYATATSGPWTSIDVTAGTNAFVMSNTSAFVFQDDPTTKQLTSGALSFKVGKIMVSSNTAVLPAITQGGNTEIEWAIKGTTNTIAATTYYFRDFSAGTTYGSFPSLTTAAVLLPIKLTGFTLSHDGKKIRIDWVTASEQNNDRFEIQRSSEGRTWKTIAKMKGSGTTATSHSYRVYDDFPLSGINYYLIKQYDVDGHSYLSDVKYVRMPVTKSIVSVYPNPTHSTITFSIINMSASNVKASITSIDGSIVHQEIFKSVSANTINKLNLEHRLSAGVYILKLKAENISESVRVIIE
jgi:hypothetical protein